MVQDTAARAARAMIEFRRLRAATLPRELFAQPAWDLLLELFVADAEGKRLTARMVSTRHGVVPSVMARWLAYLSQLGLVVGDGVGDLDDLLTLSATAMSQMETLMAHADEAQSRFEEGFPPESV